MARYNDAALRTKQNIIDSFWNIYKEKRIEKITVNEITAKAGYNRSTFYQYFGDVYQVLDEIELSLLPSFDEIPIGSPEDTLEKFINLYSRQSQYYSVLLSDKGDPSFITKVKDGIKQKIMSNIIGNYNIELDYELEFKLSGMIGILTYWFKNNENITKERLVNLIVVYMR